MRLVTQEMVSTGALAGTAVGQFQPYPGSPRQKADVWIGTPLQWVIEVKMARFFGDNGKLDDTAIKDILSPYPSDRSALGDCRKLAESGFEAVGMAVLIYGFGHPDRPLEPAIDAFELLARHAVDLGSRYSAPLEDLVHPVHASGAVFAWSVATRGQT